MPSAAAGIWKEKITIPTYPVGLAETLPIFFRMRNNQGTRGGIYPYRMTDKLSAAAVDREYNAVRLENEYIRVIVLPELGGRIYEGYDKVNDYHFVYKNNVIKPALIGLCGAWISGGIEFNWPQHHRPTTFMPVECVIEEEADGSMTAWVGETEPMFGLKASVGISITPGKSYITAKTRLYNGTQLPQAFHWWANLAVHANDDYRLIFPPDIDYVTFHNKTNVSPFPEVAGSFGGADFGQGVDVRKYRNIQPASSFFIFNSGYSFMAGYDDGAGKGTVHVADRFLSPGKKFFTWGKAGYGQAWQKNLTDKDGDYLEIMTGCYTDNQPDFTYLAPSETKAFTQRWYAVCGLPGLKNATDDAAISIVEANAAIRVAINVTSAHQAVTFDARAGQTILHRWSFPALPCALYEFTVSLPLGIKPCDIEYTLTDQDGKLLLRYRQEPMYFDGKDEPEARVAPEAPEAIGTCEELWLNGLHLEQYKHPFLDSDLYYLEALRRDPLDARCNTAMAALLCRRGRHAEALPYLERAVRRLTGRNPNPTDTEAYYLKGVALLALGQQDLALDALKKAAWNYAFRSPALLLAAEIESGKHKYTQALEDLDSSLDTNRLNQQALALKAAILLHMGSPDVAKRVCMEALSYDRLDMAARFMLSLCGGEALEDITSILGGKTGAYLDLALPLLSAGLYDQALAALVMCPVSSQMIHYYMAYTCHMQGNEDQAARHRALAGSAPEDDVFPNRDYDFTVLGYAAGFPDCSACYLLGCLQYARGNGGDALAWWQKAAAVNPTFAAAHRCLAQALFETREDTAAALREMEAAFRLDPGSRILFELFQLKKVMGMPANQCLALLESHKDLIFDREDLLLQYIRLLAQCGRPEDADRILASHNFYTYEGGEGLLPRMHAFVHLSLGCAALQRGNASEALASFARALEYRANYHEGRRHGAKEAHIHYHIAQAHRALGDPEAATQSLRLAAAMGQDAGESEFFRGLALRGLGDTAGANAVFAALTAQGKDWIAQPYPGYSEGFPSALPFEHPTRLMKQRGYSAWVFGLIGASNIAEAKSLLGVMRDQCLDTLWPDYTLGNGWVI
jgi:tetratricopeptide (TPR) repeat protein